MCAVFQLDGRVELSTRVGGSLCVTKKLGHIALVEKAGMEENGRRWKTIAGRWWAAAVAAGLLGLILVAMVKGKRKRWRMAEMERRAYENEALQVSMVGHVRAATAPVVRTAPELEKEFMPPR
ncbi:hypothetical protein HPP92_027307 [Vanilla planifolia]|uniref:Transmembrane protein n=1 Tax=Vanilla planifolia TaxID=51239 RepID=A0A835U822_VANPL|nr:hypothetical protein HPP92_027307 [Vanilla planifolia]